MTRIAKTFESLDHPALITFITACDPNYETSLKAMKTLAAAGADIIELGMPFTDPMADGPAIQAASLRALEAGGSMQNTLKMVRDFRAENDTTPIVLMGYFNPVMQYGPKKFITDASAAGVDGLIIVDLPPEESQEIQSLISNFQSLDLIRLITPTSDEKRLPTILEGASGFLYYVSITGVTGTAQANIDDVKTHIKQIKKSTKLPIAIGFGIKTAEDAANMAGAGGNAIVVGSAIVQTIAENADNPALETILTEKITALKTALKS
jgi:tryptophan synthase alpha chain